MFYKLLGMLVWKGGKWFMRRRYGGPVLSKPVLAGGLALLVGGALLAARRRVDVG